MKNTGKVIFFVTIITLLTKVLTLVSGQMVLSMFGAQDVNSRIYTYAINIPNYIFTCIGTTLTTIVIPTYASLLIKKDKIKAKLFLDNTISISSVFVIGLIIISFFLTPFLVSLSDYKNDVYEFNYAVFAVRALLPVMFFTGLNFIFQGILQTNNKFKLVAAVSLPTSIISILYLVFFGEKYGVTGLIFAMLIGLSLQPLLLIPQVIQTGYRYKFCFDLKNEEIRNSLKLIPAVLLGVSAYQVNMFFNGNMSTSFGTELLISTVNNILMSPVLLFIYSITSIYYPRLSLQWGAEDVEGYKNSIEEIFSLICFLLIPATIGLILLRFNLLNLTSYWGKVNKQDIITGGNILGLNSLGIIFIGLKEVFDRAFYAQKSTKPSAYVGIAIMITNIIVSISLKNIIGTYCMPVAYSVSSFVGAISLFFMLRKKIGNLSKEIYTNMLKCFVSACIMGIVVFFARNYFDKLNLASQIIKRMLALFAPTLFGAIIYFIATYLFGVPQTKIVSKKIDYMFGK